MEMRCYRILLNLTYRDHITNAEIRNTISRAMGTNNLEDLLSIVIIRKLKWYGHVTRSKGLSKVILQGTVEGKRRRGRQRKKWDDNIREWTGLPLASTQALAHERERWREVCSAAKRPHDHTRSRDR